MITDSWGVRAFRKEHGALRDLGLATPPTPSRGGGGEPY